MIYFVQGVDGGPIKIGHSSRLSVRLQQIEREKGIKLKLLGVTEGGRAEEKDFHEAFFHIRTGKFHICEWFHPTPELMEFIGYVAKPWDGKDDAPRTQGTTLSLAMSKDYLAWLKRLAEIDGGTSPVGLIERAVLAYAHKLGITDNIPRRYEGAHKKAVDRELLAKIAKENRPNGANAQFP